MMCFNKVGGFKKPSMDKLVWKCPACKGFNALEESKCKKCGADKPAEEKK